MTTFPVKFLDGHIIAHANNFDYLIDTGSPVSFGRGEKLVINEQNFHISVDGTFGVTVDSISALSGLHIDGLIGMDILSNFDMRFTRNQIFLSKVPIKHADTAIVLPLVGDAMGIPITSLKIAHEERRIFFDTGAKLSYLSEDLLIGDPIGEMDDFYPTIGKYKTNVYKIDVDINGKVEALTFGLLPVSIRMLLEMGQTKGVVGTELLKKYTIILSNSNKSLILEPINEHESFDQDQNANGQYNGSSRQLTLLREPSLD